MQEQIELQIQQLTRNWKWMMDNILNKFNLTHSNWIALRFISLHSTEYSQVQIAREIGIEHPSLVRTLCNLEEKGLICRHTSTKDRRSNVVTLTEKAESIMRIVENTIKKSLGNIFNGFTENEIEALSILLTRLQGNISTASLHLKDKTP